MDGLINWLTDSTLGGLVLMMIRIIVIFAGVMTMVPILIWMERRVVAGFQFRVGPNRLGPLGLFQPLADALKLVMKEDITPRGVNKFLFFIAPILAMVPAILAAGVIPWGPLQWMRVTSLNHSLLFSFLISSLGVYAVALAGWASNNKYSLMGAMRSSAQMVSYELGMGLSLIAVALLTSSLSLHHIVEQQHIEGWNVIRTPTMFIAFLIFFISGIAETNRAPFDMAEAETELVAGFHTEYSSFKFAMFFMAEYIHMVMISALATTLFLGGWSGPGVNFDPATGTMAGGWPFALLGVAYFLAKTFFFLFIYMWIRASMPRFRYDQLMNFGWKRLLPISLANIGFVALWIAYRSGWFNTGA